MKRLQRSAAESTETAEKMIALCQAYGYRVDFPWQLPEILEQLLSASSVARTGAAVKSQQRKEGGNAKKMLEDMTSGMSGMPADLSRLRVLQPIPAKSEEGVAPELVAGLFEKFGEPEPEQDSEDEMTPAQEDMLRAYQEKNQRMFERVSKKGISYGRGGANSPYQGVKIQPHESMQVGSGEEGSEDESESEDVEIPPSGGRVNPKTGMSLEQQRSIMGKVLGREVKPPKDGMPNLLKR